jgi:hypothetical protein
MTFEYWPNESAAITSAKLVPTTKNTGRMTASVKARLRFRHYSPKLNQMPEINDESSALARLP